MAIIKVLSKELAFLGAFYLSIRYLGDFSSQQSAVLTFLAWICYELYAKLSASRRVESVFEPFSVSIYPNWYELLSDFKLIGGMEEWHRFREETEKLPTSEYSVFRSGFHFTVIRPPSDGLLPGLTFWDNRKIFLSDVDLSESIVKIKDESVMPRLEKQHAFFKHPEWGQLPEIYFKWGVGGYKLGMEVQQEWWEKHCKSGEIGELAKTKTHKDYLCGTTRLEIATLPYSEFGIYYDVSVDQKEEREKVRDKQLEANGWKRKDRGDSEIRDPWSHVENKYFTVSHRGI
jgi:hypothetical protein